MKTVNTISKEEWDALVYPVSIQPLPEEEGGGWYAWIPALGHGLFSMTEETPGETLRLLEEHRRDVYDLVIESGAPIPIPMGEDEMPSGKWLQRTSPTLHASLKAGAEREGTSFNAYATACLERGHAARSAASEVAHAVRETVREEMARLREEVREEMCRAVREEVSREVARFTIEVAPERKPATLYAFNNAPGPLDAPEEKTGEAPQAEAPAKKGRAKSTRKASG